MLHPNPVINELIETEKSYNQTLVALLEKDLPSYQGSELFIQFTREIRTLRTISDHLIASTARDATGKIPAENIGKRAELIQAFFRQLRAYTPLYERFVKEHKGTPGSVFDTKLITPIQRSMRYALLMDAILKQGGLESHVMVEVNEQKQLIMAELIALNTQKRAYRFGDYTRKAYGFFARVIRNTMAAVGAASSGYQFGDISMATFRLIRGLLTPKQMQEAIENNQISNEEAGNINRSTPPTDERTRPTTFGAQK